MRIPIRLLSKETQRVELYPRLASREPFAWVYIFPRAGTAKLNLIDGAERIFAFNGSPIERSLVSFRVHSLGHTREPVVIEIAAGTDGFQGEMHIEHLEADASSSNAGQGLDNSV